MVFREIDLFVKSFKIKGLNQYNFLKSNLSNIIYNHVASFLEKLWYFLVESFFFFFF